MSAASLNAATKAKIDTASPCSRNEAGLQTSSLVMRVAQAFWPKKTAVELKIATRASDRMIQYWLSNRYAISADDLVNLLRTDAGLTILENIIGDAKPIWWRDFKRATKRAELRRQQAALAKALEENEQVELNL